MLDVEFGALVRNFENESQQSLCKSTIGTYSQLLQFYEATITRIPSAPPPFPPTKETIGAFLKYKKDFWSSYSTLKAYLVALSHYCRANKIL